MSIKTVDYIPCSRRSYRLIGSTEKYLCVEKLGEVSTFDVTISWIFLNCCLIQSERVDIREVRHS